MQDFIAVVYAIMFFLIIPAIILYESSTKKSSSFRRLSPMLSGFCWLDLSPSVFYPSRSPSA